MTNAQYHCPFTLNPEPFKLLPSSQSSLPTGAGKEGAFSYTFTYPHESGTQNRNEDDLTKSECMTDPLVIIQVV